MLLGDDMLDMKWPETGVFLVKATVLTPPVGPAPNKGSESRIHHPPEELARS